MSHEALPEQWWTTTDSELLKMCRSALAASCEGRLYVKPIVQEMLGGNKPNDLKRKTSELNTHLRALGCIFDKRTRLMSAPAASVSTPPVFATPRDPLEDGMDDTLGSFVSKVLDHSPADFFTESIPAEETNTIEEQVHQVMTDMLHVVMF